MGKKLITILMALILITGNFGTVESQAAKVKILGKLSINVGKSKPLIFTDPNGNQVDVLWKSSKTKVATVTAQGVVTGKKKGITILSTTWNGKSYGVKIKAKATKKATTKKTLSLNKKKLKLQTGKKKKLKLKNAKNSKVKWSTSNKKVVTVSPKGVVKAKKKGKATITAKYKRKKYRCKVTVTSKKKKKSGSKKGLTIKQAFEKVKKYCIQNGKHEKFSFGLEDYKCFWKKGSMNYCLLYNKTRDEISFIGESNGLSIDLFMSEKDSILCQFDYTGQNSANDYSMTLETKKSTFVLENTPDFEYADGKKTNLNLMNMNAKATLDWMFPDFDEYIRKKAGISMKQLGFKKWK